MKLIEIFGHDDLSYDRSKQTRWPDYFGIELEVENCNNPESFGQWITHQDGSLRNGVEFVLDGPVGGAKLEKAIADFYSRGLRYTAGPRTSTHIHINARDMDLDQLRTMMVVMHIVEDQLFNAVGEARKWAGYATGLAEMDGKRLRNILTSNEPFTLMNAIAPGRNQERYYGFNVASAKRHGTVEFRHFPGGPTIDEMRSWLDFTWSVKNLALNISLDKMLALNNPDELVGLLAAFFTKEWQDKVLLNEDKESLYRKFCEIGALCGDPDMERRERIVFLTKPLTDFINKILLGEEGHQAFAKVLKNFTVLGMGDFQHYLDDAMAKDTLSNKKKKVAPALEQQVAEARQAMGDLRNINVDVVPREARVGRGRVPVWAQVRGDAGFQRMQEPDHQDAPVGGWGQPPPAAPQPLGLDELAAQAEEERLRYEEVRRRAQRMFGDPLAQRAAPAAPEVARPRPARRERPNVYPYVNRPLHDDDLGAF